MARPHGPRRNWSATPSMTLLTFQVAAWLGKHTSRMEHALVEVWEWRCRVSPSMAPSRVMLLSLHMLHQAACLEELVDEAAWWARPPRDCDSDVYLSMVMVGRNDNYGGTFQSRLATSLRINLHLLNKHTPAALPASPPRLSSWNGTLCQAARRRQRCLPNTRLRPHANRPTHQSRACVS